MNNRRWAALTLLGALSACSSGQSTAPQPLTLTGEWEQSLNVTDPVNGDSHISAGRFVLQQNGASFQGTGQQSGFCNTAHGATYTGPLADPTPFAISNGVVTADAVSFDRDICTYTGAYSAGNSNRIKGTVTCHYIRNGIAYNFSGPWGADRIQ